MSGAKQKKTYTTKKTKNSARDPHCCLCNFIAKRKKEEEEQQQSRRRRKEEEGKRRSRSRSSITNKKREEEKTLFLSLEYSRSLSRRIRCSAPALSRGLPRHGWHRQRGALTKDKSRTTAEEERLFFSSSSERLARSAIRSPHRPSPLSFSSLSLTPSLLFFSSKQSINPTVRPLGRDLLAGRARVPDGLRAEGGGQRGVRSFFLMASIETFAWCFSFLVAHSLSRLHTHSHKQDGRRRALL